MSEFLAEAAVLVRANTEAFRTELLAEVKSAVAAASKIATVPITPVVVSGAVAASAKKAAAEVAAASQAASQVASRGAGISAASLEAEQKQRRAAIAVIEEQTGATVVETAAEERMAALRRGTASAAATSYAKVERALVAARLQGVAIIDGLIAGEIGLAEANAAAAAAREFLTTAELQGIDSARLLEITTVKEALAMGDAAAATRAKAVADEQAAVAAGHHAVAVRNVGRGSATAALSAAGLRGATLTANAGFIAGAAAAIGFGKAIQTATSFDTSLNVFAATVGATGEEMANVSKVAQQLGRDITLPSVNALDAAQAMTELAKAGLSVEDSIDGARGVLQLATAAAIDNAQATELAASALNAFGLAGNQAVHVADVLTNAANESQGSIVDIGSALGQAAAVARQAGLSLETTAAVLTLFARNGLRGSDAGTSLRTALIRLINPTDKAAKIIKDLGLNLRTATGAVDITVFDQFARATRNLSAAQRDQALAVIFGQDAIRGAAILAREGAAGLNQETVAMNKAGSAAELAAARTKGLAGEFENAKNQAAAFGLVLGQIASGPVAVFLRGVGNLFESLNKVSGKIGGFINPKDFDATAGSIETMIGRVQKLDAELTISPEFAPLFEDRLKELEDALAATGQRMVSQGFLTRFIDVFKAASPDVKRAMEDNVITPSEQAQLAASGIGRAFLAALPHTAEFFESFGAGAKSGIEDAAAAVRGGGPQLASAMRSTVEDAAAQAKAAAAASGAQVGTSFSDSVAAAIRAGKSAINQAFANTAASARLGAAAASSELLDLEFQGASDQQILAVLRKKKARQDKLVATLEARPGAKQVKIDRAKQDAIATQNDIDAAQARIDAAREATVRSAKQAAADRAAKAKEVADANNAADQAILDSFSGAQNKIDLASISANASERLSDDIAVQKLIANTASREIAIISKSVQDAKTRNAAIAERVKTLKSAGAELDRLRKEAADAAAQKERDTRDAITERLGKKLQLAQIIGDKDPILAAFNALIANERKNLAAAKKADKLDALIALQQTIKDRNEFIKGISKDAADGAKQATTAFDLLKQFTDVFNQNAGNLIGANQPFAGPTGFTADIAQFLVRRPGGQAAATTKADINVPLIQSNAELIRVIRENTDVIRNQNGNRSSGVGSTVKRTGHGLGRTFVDSNQVRQSIEARSGI